MKAVNELKAQGARGMIFDLRFNGGGLVDSAVNILDEILPKCKIVSLQIKNHPDTVYESDDEKKLDMPIAVLVSGRTASAAEIFAGAIKDNNYGTLIGYKTFGKGVVQTIYPLSDGSAIKLTTAEYFTPKHTSIQKKGLEPDEVVKEAEGFTFDGKVDLEKDNQLQRAIEILKTKE